MHQNKKIRASKRRKRSSPDLLSNIPDDIIDQILSCLPPKDAGKTRLLSKTWQNKWTRWIENHGDRITTLPPNLISQILSRLPTKDAMRTSVLSHSWKNKWTSVNKIDVVDHNKYLTLGTDFVNVMTWILLRTCNTQMRSFRVSYNKVSCLRSFKPLEIWIREIFRRNVPYVTIEATQVGMYCSPGLFSGWTLLTVLKLALSCTLELPAAVSCLSNLKSLSLSTGYGTYGFDSECIKIRVEKSRNNNCSRKIKLHFPVLEFMELILCKWLEVDSVKIRAPKLICFKTRCLYRAQKYKIKISAPALVKFETTHGVINNFVLRTPSVTYAAFIMNEHEHYCIPNIARLKACMLLKKFTNLKSLTLSGSMVKGLIQYESYDQELVLPTFDGIKEFKLCSGSVSTNVLMDMLRVLPSLEMLSMDLMNWFNCVHNETELPMPPCILSNLKEVKLTNYSDRPGLLELIKSFVQNAGNLKNLLVQVIEKKFTHIRSDLNKAKPKGSSCVIVVQKQRYAQKDYL